MNWKRIGRTLVCLLVAAVLLFNISPLRARAIEPISTLTGIGIAAFIIALSAGVVLHVSSPEDIEALGQSFRTQMYQWGTEAEQLDDVEEFFNGLHIYEPPSGGSPGDYRFTIPNAIKNLVTLWMISQVLGEVPIVVPGGAGIVDADIETAKAWLRCVDFVGLARSAEVGQFFMAARGGAGSSVYAGFEVLHDSILGLNYLAPVMTRSLAPYIISNYPLGSFCFVDSVQRGYSPNIYFSFDDAYKAYSTNSGSEYYFLTDSTYLEPIERLNVTSTNHISNTRFFNLGRISSSGQVSYNYSGVWAHYEDYGYYESSGIVPGDYHLLDQTLIGDIAPGIQDGSITDDAISLPDSFNYADILTYGGKTGVDSIYDLSNDLQSGDLTYDELQDMLEVDTSTGTGDDSVAGDGSIARTPWSTFVDALTDFIVTPILNGIKALFVPDAAYFQAKLSALGAKYGFVDSIMKTGVSLVEWLYSVKDSGVPPIIYIDLGATSGDYYMGGKVPFVDLTWFAKYKSTTDQLLSAFIWIWFVWRICLMLPGIIAGTSGFFGDGNVDPSIGSSGPFLPHASTYYLESGGVGSEHQGYRSFKSSKGENSFRNVRKWDKFI